MDGRSVQRSQGGFPSRKAARDRLNEILVELRKGTYQRPTGLTVEAYLADEWLPFKRTQVRPTTFDSYEGIMRCHVVPRLGSRRLVDVTPRDLERLYEELRAGGLSPRSVQYVHVLVRGAFRRAVERGQLARNPADVVRPARATGAGDRKEMRTWSAELVRAFLTFVQEDRLSPLWHMAFHTGMRRGELLGLRWEDVDLEARKLSIRQQLVASCGYEVRVHAPKTGRSRQIWLDTQTAAVLKRWKARQAAERLEWGSAWNDSGLVFTREDGRYHHPDRISKVFERLTAAAGLPRIRLHDARHTHATLLLQAGTHVKVVAERLGHSSIVVTMDTYSHAIPSMEAEAADRVAALVGLETL
ncbi:MAG TPA: tyrosine-type recombinase/integrase [Actinomycetota bacterium]|nr:tyrosine-type recombinase/integrase [Actinomycetota bacterium]